MESRFERFTPSGGPKPAGGGALLDFGSHLIDQALVLLGPVNSVYAEWNIGDDGLDDDAFVALTHATGAAVASLGELAAAGAGTTVPCRRH